MKQYPSENRITDEQNQLPIIQEMSSQQLLKQLLMVRNNVSKRPKKESRFDANYEVIFTTYIYQQQIVVYNCCHLYRLLLWKIQKSGLMQSILTRINSMMESTMIVSDRSVNKQQLCKCSQMSSS